MKESRTNLLNSRLLKYSLSAGTVLMGVQTANAQIWGAGPNTTINTNGGTVDINFNGQLAFKIKFVSGYPYHDINLSAQTGSGSWLNNGSGHPKGLNSGYVVSSGATAGFTNTAIFKNFVHRNPGGGGLAIGTSFFNTNKYLGVRFKISGNTHYGWIKVHVNATGNNVTGFTLISYAYEQTAGNSITADGILPVELNTFSGVVDGDKINLKWSTATEVNNYGFNVERKPETGEWMKIGFVKGSGNSNSPKDYSFVDANPLSGNVEYRLKQIDNNGAFKYSSIVSVNSLLAKFELFQNYPNPFNPTTTIRYSIPKAEHVTLKVYDELGKEVSALVDENKEAGNYEVQFNNQQTTDNKQLASGIYFYWITAGGFTDVKKLMLLK